jgi:hypothetical protein
MDQPEGEVHVQLLDIRGRVHFTQSYQPGPGSLKTQLDLGGLAKGIYFVKVITRGAIRIEKIVKD